MSLARTAGGRWSRHASGFGRAHRSGGVSSLGGPTASWTTPSVVTSVLSAMFADQVGQAAIAVTTTMMSSAQPAVVMALLMSDWRERHSRYSPTMARVIVPKTVKTLR